MHSLYRPVLGLWCVLLVALSVGVGVARGGAGRGACVFLPIIYSTRADSGLYLDLWTGARVVTARRRVPAWFDNFLYRRFYVRLGTNPKVVFINRDGSPFQYDLVAIQEHGAAIYDIDRIAADIQAYPGSASARLFAGGTQFAYLVYHGTQSRTLAIYDFAQQTTSEYPAAIDFAFTGVTADDQYLIAQQGQNLLFIGGAAGPTTLRERPGLLVEIAINTMVRAFGGLFPDGVLFLPGGARVAAFDGLHLAVFDGPYGHPPPQIEPAGDGWFLVQNTLPSEGSLRLIAALNVRTGDQRLFLVRPLTAERYILAPDSPRLAFLETWFPGSVRLSVFDLASGIERTIALLETMPSAVRWTRDGQNLIVIAQPSTPQSDQIITVFDTALGEDQPGRVFRVANSLYRGMPMADGRAAQAKCP